MAELYQSELLLQTASASLVGYTWNVLGLQTAFVEVNVLPAAATLQATILFEASIDGQAPWLPCSNGTLQASSTGAMTYAAATGVFTFNNPAAATANVAQLLFDRPAKYLRATYTYGSGGGATRVLVVGYGFQVSTTP